MKRRWGRSASGVIPGLRLLEEFVHSRVDWSVCEWSQILFICLCSQTLDITPRDLCQDWELSSTSAKRLQFKRWRFGRLARAARQYLFTGRRSKMADYLACWLGVIIVSWYASVTVSLYCHTVSWWRDTKMAGTSLVDAEKHHMSFYMYCVEVSVDVFLQMSKLLKGFCVCETDRQVWKFFSASFFFFSNPKCPAPNISEVFPIPEQWCNL